MKSQCSILLDRMQMGYTVTPDDAYRLCGTFILPYGRITEGGI